ncbi:hypothetical protein [Sphingobium baderi]|uniref:Uncharacterized protein n=1 Tax=Sphingobium baderi LL03 TaxID=1114964 RepID=T0H252_9SPHN|nr:hypothetical protein [Sphingobium baderi]EQB06173.1 hypothetical protein L485_00655 [Sphingobium baderi LL03]KMS62830.1 hypothetical protein V475_06135 [Sphingobium baderi LL03]WRD76859.1 hypothetical protein QQ987_01550 [Sphingobium baderi]
MLGALVIAEAVGRAGLERQAVQHMVMGAAIETGVTIDALIAVLSARPPTRSLFALRPDRTRPLG